MITQLQQQAQKKYNQLLMGNGTEHRALKLYNIHVLLEKPQLTEEDILVLEHFLSATRVQLEKTAYVANTAVYPTSWGYSTTVLKRKNT